MWRSMLMICAFSAAGAVAADPVGDVSRAAQDAFDRMPVLRIVPQIAGNCGADGNVNDSVAYCTTGNVIYLARAAAATPQAPYLVAHLYGHAAQVQHGVADVALATIQARRGDETLLRSYVESQVDCVAGFLVARAGLPAATLADWFAQSPFGGVHWGRQPLRIGPQVTVDLQTRDAWFQRGLGGDLAACSVGEFSAQLLVDALKP